MIWNYAVALLHLFIELHSNFLGMNVFEFWYVNNKIVFFWERKYGGVSAKFRMLSTLLTFLNLNYK